MASSENRPLLLDVNALMALAWPNHQFHTAILKRLEKRPIPRWATCALTQLGFVRLSSNPTIVEVRKRPAEAVALLEDLTRDQRHVYLETLPALPHAASFFRHILGHQQVTDAYLLAVADANGATLLTLDGRIVPPSGKGISIGAHRDGGVLADIGEGLMQSDAVIEGEQRLRSIDHCGLPDQVGDLPRIGDRQFGFRRI